MSDIDELKLLLPFYVNGTLDAQNCARIDQGLATSQALRDELDELGALAQTVREGGQAMTQQESDTDAQLGKLLDDPRMAPAEPARLMQDVQPQSASQKGLLAFLNPKNWHPAVSLALAAAAVAQGSLILGMNDDRKASGEQIAKLEKRVGDLEYQLASGPGGGSAQPDILIQVKADVSWSALSELLSAEGLTIVDGPTDNTLSLSSEAEGAALDALVARLKSSELIENADKAA